MKAMLIVPADDGMTLDLTDISAQALGPKDVRLAVRAASVNRADLLIRAGTHTAAAPAQGPQIAGIDAAGEVIEVGAQVTGVQPGDRIMAMASGGLAEEIVIPAAMAIPVPATWSYGEAAAAVIGLMTEHNALSTAARLQPGETVLIHAAASGVGTQAIQVARQLGAGRVLGTSRSGRDSTALRQLGLDELISASEHDFADRVQEVTEGAGADVIVDHVGGPYLPANIRAAAVRGRIVGVGRLGGAEGVLDLEELARKRLEIIGTTFRTRTPDEKAEVVRALRAGIDLNSAADALRPVVDRTFPWTQALEAQAALERSHHLGKIVLEVG
ncbi:zinc-binding dehydrogenase [Streptomyces sp. NPDC005263]|uniref:zinc-binding dehydrogenase n=1 Tax=Streptomyces sp. NPDC005263 TaxID=3364711 RepID=UPI003697D947